MSDRMSSIGLDRISLFVKIQRCYEQIIFLEIDVKGPFDLTFRYLTPWHVNI
jgi:hypothetical protein